MFPNTDRSNKGASTNINNKDLNNICYHNAGLNTHKNLKELIEGYAEIVIVTEHLSNPCSRLYTDIFKTILIVCNHISHKNDGYSEDIQVDNTIRQLLKEVHSK